MVLAFNMAPSSYSVCYDCEKHLVCLDKQAACVWQKKQHLSVQVTVLHPYPVYPWRQISAESAGWEVSAGIHHTPSHWQIGGGAELGKQPRFHNLGQCRSSHPHREGCRNRRPRWILTTSHSPILRLQMCNEFHQGSDGSKSTSTKQDGGSQPREDLSCTQHLRLTQRPSPFLLLPPLCLPLLNSLLYRSISVLFWCSHKFPLHWALSLFNSQLCLGALCRPCPEDVEHVFRVGVGDCWLHRWHAYSSHW